VICLCVSCDVDAVDEFVSKSFRAGLLQGDPGTVHPLMAWCLTRLDELKKRAFVGKFLVPLDVPPEYLQSPQANEAYSQVRIHVSCHLM
jgi:hypothetical protein